MNRFVGIEIGGTKLQLVLGALEENHPSQWNVLERRRFNVAKDQGAPGIRDQIESALPSLLKDAGVRSVGVGFGGPVDWRSGRICCSHQVPGWSEFPLSDWLREMTGLPVFVDNDANVAALGEARHGAGAGAEVVFYVTLGSGVGGGLVVSGNIYHGAMPGESEIGHVRLDKQGRTVESSCSGWAVDEKVREAISSKPHSALARLAGTASNGQARFLGAALAENDEVARSILTGTADDLAFGLSHVIHLFHPEVIVLGGGLSLLGEVLRTAVAEALPGYSMEAFHPVPKVRLAECGEDAVPVGALALARARLPQSTLLE